MYTSTAFHSCISRDFLMNFFLALRYKLSLRRPHCPVFVVAPPLQISKGRHRECLASTPTLQSLRACTSLPRRVKIRTPTVRTGRVTDDEIHSAAPNLSDFPYSTTLPVYVLKSCPYIVSVTHFTAESTGATRWCAPESSQFGKGLTMIHITSPPIRVTEWTSSLMMTLKEPFLR